MKVSLPFVMYETHSLIIRAKGGLWAPLQNIVEFILVLLEIL
jgi:hypothetical protein